MRWPDEPDRVRPSRAELPLEDGGKVQWARAVFEAALGDSRADDSAFQPSTRFGDYELLARLGRGATATVYRARQVSLNRVVALKLMREADLASEAEVQRFRFGAEAAAELDHPNIAPIYQVGAEDGVPFFTMRLFEGGTLAEARERLRQSQVSVAVLMAKVARAVHYAHERGVLHRDLKPANIVLDAHDEPFVVDFGFAKHLDERAITSKPSIVVGTMGYMAPEQAAGEVRSLTFASDIYALGTIFYELLTGQVPYQGLAFAGLVERLTSAEPVRSPRALEPAVDRELALVCLKCLEKDPVRRYGTAAELAQDLERWLRLEPVSIKPDSSAASLWRWCRGHPALATSLAGAVFVLAATAAVAVSVAREQGQLLLRQVVRSNSYAAESKAGHVLSQLRELSYPVARCASDPRIADVLVSTGDSLAQPAHAERLLVECGAKTVFDSVAIVDREGNERARLPNRSQASVREQVVERDYFTGAKRLVDSGYRSVHVGRVLRSEDDGARRVSLSAPIFDTDNQWLGVVAVTIDMKAFLESLRLLDRGGQMAMLAGVREREPGDPINTSDEGVMVLLHDRLGDTPGMPASSRWLSELMRLKRQSGGLPFRVSESNDSSEDSLQAYPESPFGMRWLAGFAPVGHTGYAVVVQTRSDEALDALLDALLRLLAWSGAIFVLGASAVLSLAWTLGERMRVTRR